MFKIHTADGQTVRVDLSDSEQAREWLPKLARDDFQATVTGVSLVERHEAKTRCSSCGGKGRAVVGVQYSVTRPHDFGRIYFQLEDVPPEGRIRGGERAVLFVDNVRLTMMAHRSQPSVRVGLTKTGKQIYNPNQHGGST